MRRTIRRNFFANLSITNWIILINVVFFFLSFPLIIANSDNIKYVALQPAGILQGKYLWTLITHMFMHGSFFHLLINMFVLFSLGNFCERIIGKKRFIWFYLISGLISALFFIVLAGLFGGSELGFRLFGSPDIFAVGASGVIFAIAGLFVILTPKIRFAIIFFPFFSLPGYIMIPAVLLLMWILSFLFPASFPFGNSAHFGGFIAGLVYALYLKNKYPKKTQMLGRMFR